jgi:hypothetical protein
VARFWYSPKRAATALINLKILRENPRRFVTIFAFLAKEPARAKIAPKLKFLPVFFEN